MKTLIFILISAGILGSNSQAQAIDIDSYLGAGQYYFDGKLSESYPASVEKETVFVAPVNENMVRYVFRSHKIVDRPEIAFFTIYLDNQGNWYSYMDDMAYLRSATESFKDVATLNPNKWVAMKESGNKLECTFYPGDLGEQKFTFEFNDKSIKVTEFEWEQWFGMIPLPKTNSSEFKF